MAFNSKYIAWLNGTSVAVGTRREVERKAREIAATPLWLERNPETNLKITTYGSQKFCSSIILRNPTA